MEECLQDGGMSVGLANP